MSAVLFLRSWWSRVPPGLARQAVGCCYHTERGVYGYRPKHTDGPHELQRDRIAALNQGQYGVNSPCGRLTVSVVMKRLYGPKTCARILVYHVVCFALRRRCCCCCCWLVATDGPVVASLCAQITVSLVWWRRTELMDTRLQGSTPYYP